jgi:Ca2+-binding EF-hand superfamily protein
VIKIADRKPLYPKPSVEQVDEWNEEFVKHIQGPEKKISVASLKVALASIGLDTDDLRVFNLRIKYPDETIPVINFEHFYYFAQILPAKLTLEAVVKAFKKIDKNGNGTVSKQRSE